MGRVLILGAGLYHRRAIEVIRDAGYETYVLDRDRNAPGATASFLFEPIDIVDVYSVEQFARRHKVKAIIPLNDFAVRTAAKVSKALGLLGISLEAAIQSCDKGRMRKAWKRAGLAQPNFKIVKNADINFLNLSAAINTIGLPCVIKPTDCGGSGRGVSVIQDNDDIAHAFNRTKPFTSTCDIIVEEFMDGMELTVEAIFDSTQCGTVLAMSDKEKPNLKTRVATSLNYSAAINESTRNRVENLVLSAAKALDITVGMIHAEVIVEDGTPKMVEIGARGGGGHIFHTLIETVSGISAPVTLVEILMGKNPVKLVPQRKGGVYRFMTPNPGRLRSDPHLDVIRNSPGVLDIGMVAKRGDVVGIMENSLGRCGHIVTKGQNREEAIHNANVAEELLHLDIVDLI